MQHLQTNTTLQGGKYRIERLLGQGGFGIAYLAVQTSLNRKVAIKEFFMKDYCLRGEDTITVSTPQTDGGRQVEMFRKKFRKEAETLARLHHPNIIDVIDVFDENDTVYFSMPYLSGGSLLDYVKSNGSLSEQEAMKYIKQIANALKYMHEDMHICHYDVKPANILLDENGNAVLIDFGISKNYDSKGMSSTPVGVSDGYAPIEQYGNDFKGFSPASDVYALGATLYFLLHGKRPINALSRTQGTSLLMSRKLSQDVKDIINASMKIMKVERAQSMDVFLGKIKTSTQRSNPSSTTVDKESTLLDKNNERKTRDNFNGHSYQSSNNSNANGTTYVHGSSSTTNAKSSFTAHTHKQSDSSNGIWLIVVGVIIISAIVLFAKNYGWFNDSNKTYSPDTVYIDNTIEESLPSDTAYVEPKKTFDWNTMENAFSQVMYRHCMAEDVQCEYFYYDITGDGLPELWVKSGTCEADFTLYVYTYDNGAKKIFEQSAGHSMFFSGKNYIILMSAHMGYSTWTKITYDGKIRSKIIFQEDTNGTDRDYKYPSEEGVDMRQYN